MEDVIVAVSWEWLVTAVARVAPLKTTTEEETKLLPVAMMTKLGGSCEKTMVFGEIELRIGAGRALPQRRFSVLQPGRSKSTTNHELRRTIRQVEDMNCESETTIGLSHLMPFAAPRKLSNPAVETTSSPIFCRSVPVDVKMAFRAFTNSDSMCFKLTKLPSPDHDIRTTGASRRLRQLALFVRQNPGR